MCLASPVAFKVYDMDRDGFISNGELFLVLKMMVGNNLKVRRRRLQTRSLVVLTMCSLRTSSCSRLWTRVGPSLRPRSYADPSIQQ